LFEVRKVESVKEPMTKDSLEQFFDRRQEILRKAIQPKVRKDLKCEHLHITGSFFGKYLEAEEGDVKGALPYSFEYGSFSSSQGDKEAPFLFGTVVETNKTSAGPCKELGGGYTGSVRNRFYGLHGSIEKLERGALAVLSRLSLCIKVIFDRWKVPIFAEEGTAFEKATRFYGATKREGFAAYTYLGMLCVYCGVYTFMTIVCRKFVEKLKQIPRYFYPGKLALLSVLRRVDGACQRYDKLLTEISFATNETEISAKLKRSC